jgi:hypothetical protein
VEVVEEVVFFVYLLAGLGYPYEVVVGLFG